MTNLCKDAAMESIRELGSNIANINANKVRPIIVKDLKNALDHVKPSVSKQTLKLFEDWNKEFGCN